jgi:phenylacetate-coenzyme A ligase PaaK-like adenylate-forming protein
VSEKETGRVIVTNLTNFRMPLIRYELNDYATFLDGCACGMNLPTISDVIERRENIIILPENKIIFPEEIIDILISFPLKDFMTIRIFQQSKNLIKIFYQNPAIGNSFIAKFREKIGNDVKLKLIKSNKLSQRKWDPICSKVRKI